MRMGRKRGARPKERAFTCLVCRTGSRDRTDEQLGYCPVCREFTGLCGAGRRIFRPDILNAPGWHSPCTVPGIVPWQITPPGQEMVNVLLCGKHDREAWAAPWIAGHRGPPRC